MKDRIPIVTTYAFVYFACHRTREMESWGGERERELEAKSFILQGL